MTGEILNAVLMECKQLLQSTGAMVILKTDFKKPDGGVTYSGNMIMLSMDDAQESFRYPGGLTRMEWNMGFDSYNYEPNTMADDESGYSEQLLNFVDMIRQHFSSALETGGFLTQAMQNVYNTYGFQFTFGGVRPATGLELDGLVMGWGIYMESTALDQSTLNTVPSSSPLMFVNQIVPTPPPVS